MRQAKGRGATIFRRCDEAPFIDGWGQAHAPVPDLVRGGHYMGGGGGARISRLPAWLAAPTTPSFSIRSISEAARL